MLRLLGVEELVILDSKNRLRLLYMWAAHSSTHSYPKITLAKSRSYGWISRGYSLAMKVCKSCSWCSLQMKKRVEQRLGDVQSERLGVGLPPWTYVAIDLAAPILVKGMVNKRSQMKCWPLLICCMLTGSIHLSLMTGYGAQHFLMAWWIFCELRGYPARVQSDSGSQLKASVAVVTWQDQEDPSAWDWGKVTAETARKGTEFKIVEPGCQWRNGLAEAQIKAMKRSLFQIASNSMIKSSSPTLDFQEWTLLLHRVANISNERPLGVRSITEDVIVPITPNQLLIGKTRGSVTCPDTLQENYSAQRTYSDILLQTWWSAWYPQVFDNLIPYQSYRDSKRHKNLSVGDVCLLRYDSKVMASYRYCRIVKVEMQDGIVRNVVVRLGKRGKDTSCKEMKVGVQRLVLVTPAERVSDEVSAEGADNRGNEATLQCEDVAQMISDEDVMNDVGGSENKSREVKNLKVPSWMVPSGSKRSNLNSVFSYSTIQGLNLGVLK